MHVVERLKISPDPVRVLLSPDGSSCVVASLWSRRLTFVALGPERGDSDSATTSSHLRIARVLNLPFCPRNLAWVRGGTKLVVADGFGGKLAVVDARGGSLESVRSLPAHNIRGLAAAPDGKTLVVAHQTMNGPVRTTRERSTGA